MVLCYYIITCVILTFRGAIGLSTLVDLLLFYSVVPMVVWGPMKG